MQAFYESLLTTFADAQMQQVSHWLLNIQLYLAVAALLLLSLLVPAYRWSARTTTSLAHDYLYGVFSTLITFPLLAVCLLMIKAAMDTWLPWANLQLYSHLPAVAQVLLAIVLTDLLKFIVHVVHHKVKWCWYFHTIHHSQRELNPLTTKRVHLGERVIGVLLIGWIPLAVMGSPAEVWLAYYLVDAVWDYFIHSNLRISLGPLKYVLVSPLYHRLHHSAEPRHFDKNFADRLVIWDVLLGTADFDFSRHHATGVPASTIAHETKLHPWSLVTTFGSQFMYPFRMILVDLATRRSRGFRTQVNSINSKRLGPR